MSVSEGGSWELVKLLMDAGADTHAQDKVRDELRISRGPCVIFE
jgi:hypothetical protein